jgi:type VI secretion system protein ImpK
MSPPIDDPKTGGDRTILRPNEAVPRKSPTPGTPPPGIPPVAPGLGARSAVPPPPAAPMSAPSSASPANLSDFLSGDLNPLLQAATPLLILGRRLRSTVSVPDVSSLHRQVFMEIHAFENYARSAGANAEDVLAARYVLCTALDEAVLNTPWGAQSEWATQTLLISFHREAFGGQKFFQILERIVGDPQRYINLMELMYACLALGFEGRYRLEERGASRLVEVQQDLYQRIRAVRGAAEGELSPHWRGVAEARNRVTRYVPLWIVALAALAVLVVVYIGLYASIGRRSETVMGALGAIGAESLYQPPPVSSAGPRLKALLAQQERSGKVKIDEQPDRTTVTVPAPDLFASGSADINQRYRGIFEEIADALNQVPGRVSVVGHTDDQPIQSFTFGNNQQLSLARARAVVAVLNKRLTSRGRLEAVGRGSDQPIALPANLPEHRALNRRVEIIQWQGP